jgi:hypothetical protein
MYDGRGQLLSFSSAPLPHLVIARTGLLAREHSQFLY